MHVHVIVHMKSCLTEFYRSNILSKGQNHTYQISWYQWVGKEEKEAVVLIPIDCRCLSLVTSVVARSMAGA